MNKVAIFTDSCADLPPNLYQERNINVIPFIVNIGGNSYYDGVDMTPQKLFVLNKELKQLPTTASPSAYYYAEYIRPKIEEGYDAVYLGIGRELSLAYKNIMQVEALLPAGRFFHFDAMTLSSAIGLQVLKACDLRDQGLSAKEIVDALAPKASNVMANFTVYTLDYLKKGGRVSSFKAFVGSVLWAKPIFGVRNGLLNARHTVFGKFSKAINFMVDELIFHYQANNLVNDYLLIAHIDNEEGFKLVCERLEAANITFKQVINCPIGCTIGSHCGPKTIGLLYEVKDKDIEYQNDKG